MGMREEFEAWVVVEAESSGYGYMDCLLVRDATGENYSTTWVDMMWQGWQASREELVIELPSFTTECSGVIIHAGPQIVLAECIAAIESAGVRVKP